MMRHLQNTIRTRKTFAVFCHPRKKKSKSYAHKYRPEWEKVDAFKNWIQPSAKGVNSFSCKVCNESLIGGISSVKKHSSSLKHEKKCKVLQHQPKLTTISVSNISSSTKIKKAEIKLGMFIPEHNLSFNLAGDLVDLVKNISSDLDQNEIKNIICNRTKCTKIVTNVIGEDDFDRIIADIKRTKFSLIVDESTDISCKKSLAIVVRYVCDDYIVRDQFLSLINVNDGTANGIYSSIVEFFVQNDVPYKTNLIGLGADGCNTMMGEHHSLQSLIKKIFLISL